MYECVLAQLARFHRILVHKVTSSNSDRLLKERDAFIISFLNKHMCYCSSITLIVHKVVWNVKNPDTVFHRFSHIRGACLGRRISGSECRKIVIYLLRLTVI